MPVSVTATARLVAVHARRHGDPAAVGGVLDRVGDQALNRALEVRGVAAAPSSATVGRSTSSSWPRARGRVGTSATAARDDGAEVDREVPDRVELGGVQAGEHQQVGDELLEAHGVAHRDVDHAFLLGRERAEVLAGDHLEVALHAGQRRAQLVGDRRHHVSADPRRVVQRALRRLLRVEVDDVAEQVRRPRRPHRARPTSAPRRAPGVRDACR